MKTVRSFATRIDLPESVRDPMIALLNQQLADTLDLYTQAKQAHWNVKGMQFIALHELFDKVADPLDETIDTIAERITALGGIALGTVRMAAAAARLPDYPADIVDGEAHVAVLADRFAAYAQSTRAAIDAAAAAGDAATADLFTQIARDIDKHLWFIEAHLQG